MRLGGALSVLLVAAAMAGCIGGDEDIDPATSQPPTPANACEHPWPCEEGTHWPAGLKGPFELDEIRHERVASFDGTELDGHIYLPDVPGDVQVPVVLWSLPYLGQTQSNGDDPDLRDNPTVPIGKLVEQGYAVAAFNVRGTGTSGGCFEMFGPGEQRDQAELVTWLGEQDWSNGRVAMMGLSYHGTTPWEAAIRSPEALKTIVVAGMVSDLYTFHHTPQGAPFTIGAGFQTYFNALVTGPPLVGVANGGPPERATTQWAPVAPERVCPEVAETMTSLYQGTLTDDRNPDYWQERRLIDGFPNVTAAVLLTHGFQDKWGSGHQQQELSAWHALPETTPKHQLEGQWGHEFPVTNSYNEDWTIDDWHEQAIAWLDYWLKGIGDPPEQLGTVDYQDGTGAWHTTTAWPPAEAREEVLYLSDQQLTSAPGQAAGTFLSAPDPVGSLAADESMEGLAGPLCTRDVNPLGPPHGLLYATEPLDRPVTLAGNPFAYLTLTSNLPGGMVTVAVLDLGPEFRCENGQAQDARAITIGSADLRFHEGTYQGTDFPTDQASKVRIDLTNLAEVLEPGHRLAAFVSFGDPGLRVSQPFTPTVDVGGESHLVLPLVEGSLGGDGPMVDYPPRPFTPPPGASGGR